MATGQWITGHPSVDSDEGSGNDSVTAPNQSAPTRLNTGVRQPAPAAPVQEDLDAQAFEVWVAPHWSAMTGLARRMCLPSDVEDVTQEALAEAWRQRRRFDPERGAPQSWLLAITADQARRLDRKRRKLAVPTDRLDALPVSQPLPDTDLGRAIGRLAPRQRMAIDLYYYLGLPLAEVAETMNCAEGTVKSTLSDARRILRRFVKEFPDA